MKCEGVGSSQKGVGLESVATLLPVLYSLFPTPYSLLAAGFVMPTAYVVGSINRDIVAYVDKIPAPGETVSGTGSAQFPGGKGSNQAVALARLASKGTAVAMLGSVGEDGFGRDMLAFLAGEKIDVSRVGVLPGVPTGIALINVDPRGENAIAVAPGANHAWPNGLPALDLTARDIVVCQLEVPVEITTAAFAAAKTAGAATLLNPSPMKPLPPELLRATDILVVNEIEAAALLEIRVSEIDDRRLVPSARGLIALGPRAVVVTLGAAGVLAVEADGRATRLPAPAVRAVDTTGAGDCFVGALAAALLRDETLAAAAAFANRAAAISVTRKGAAASYPRSAELA